ncbi:type II secretion system protein GspL [Pseudoalteromonas sp. SMS1]|uniref:type II secretion system protein GspL n=1 Tax=Pseudoalteromonas sp. SMS1 TaxID=2908894 RepID=UPI001F24BDAF|nr:type II secretion system protein GspL [Pseudoalteromonas sp. SMS1]MCF2859592.1 type II secretion system protein GspL [Pseudoalteromonas sp. SMS1]
MTEKLLIRVGQSQQEPVNWLIWSESDAQIIASGELEHSGLIGELTEKATTRSVALLLPASSVQLKQVELPTKWSRKLERALPFMLEEQVASDIDELFIAIGNPVLVDEKHFINIALCDLQWLAEWVAVLSDFDIEPAIITPDALLLPNPEDNALSAIQLHQQWLFKGADWHISGVEIDWVSDYLMLAPEAELIHYSPTHGLATTKSLQARESEYDLPLAIFAQGLNTLSINLRQGPFAAKKKQPQWWRDWKAGTIAASIALLAFVCVKSTQLVMLQSEAAEYKAQAMSTYKQAFPNKVVRPHLLRKQIQNELAALSGTEQSGFLELTNHFVSIYGQVSDFAPETFRYDRKRNELRIRAKAKGFQVFSQVKSILEQRGMSVQQGALNNDGDYVIGEIRIRGAA